MRIIVQAVILFAFSSVAWGQGCGSIVRNPKTHLPDCIGPTGSGTGDVTGPGSSTDNAVVRFDSTTGKLIQNSGVIVDDSNNVSGIGTLARTSYDIHTAVAAPGTPAAGLGRCWVDSTSKAFTCKDDAGNITQTWSLGLGLTQAGNQALVDTGLIGALAVANAWTAVQTFSANKVVLTPGADSGSTAGSLNIDASGNLDWYSGARIFAMRNAGTTRGDIFFCSATATPCVPTRLAAGSADTFLRFNGPGADPSANQVQYSNLGGTQASAQIPAVPLTAGTSVTLTENNRYFVCTSTCTVTVPVPAAGVQYCVYNDNNVSTVITLAAIGSSARYENTARTAYGTAGTGTFVSGGAVKDEICIVGRDTTHYSTLTFSGTWTAN